MEKNHLESWFLVSVLIGHPSIPSPPKKLPTNEIRTKNNLTWCLTQELAEPTRRVGFQLVYIYIYMYESVFVYIYICICIYMYICVCIYIYVCIYMCVYMCMFVCVCICMYICMYVYEPDNHWWYRDRLEW